MGTAQSHLLYSPNPLVQNQMQHHLIRNNQPLTISSYHYPKTTTTVVVGARFLPPPL